MDFRCTGFLIYSLSGIVFAGGRVCYSVGEEVELQFMILFLIFAADSLLISHWIAIATAEVNTGLLITDGYIRT